MVGRDDIVVLYYNGIRHTFRISERFGFLTALDEEMRRCALVIDKTKKMEEIPASDFEVMEDPVYSFEANERVLNYTLLDSFELHESLVAKNVMKIESDEEGEQENLFTNLKWAEITSQTDATLIGNANLLSVTDWSFLLLLSFKKLSSSPNLYEIPVSRVFSRI